MPEHPTNIIDVMPVGVWEVFIPILREADEKPEVFVRSLTLVVDFARRKEVKDPNLLLQTLPISTQYFPMHFFQAIFAELLQIFRIAVVNNKSILGLLFLGLR